MEPVQLYHKIDKNLRDNGGSLLDSIRLGSYVNLQYNKLKEAEELARTDTLTQLPNRRALDEILTREESDFQRHGSPLTIAMIDFNRFKDINDNDGHVLGDYALQQVAGAIRDSLREEDVVARYGGDEFCVVLPRTDYVNAQRVIDRIAETVNGLSIEGISSSVSISIGYAQMELDENYKDTLVRADQAMFQAKKESRIDNTTQSKAA